MPESFQDPTPSPEKAKQTYVRLPWPLQQRYEAAAETLERSVSFLLRRAAERDIAAVEREAAEAKGRAASESRRRTKT